MTWQEIKHHPDFDKTAWWDQELQSEFDGTIYIVIYDDVNNIYYSEQA